MNSDFRNYTTCESKKLHYASDGLFKESWGSLIRSVSSDYHSVCNNVGFIFFKPEAIRARKIEPALQLLEDQGYSVIETFQSNLDWLTLHEVWRFQLQLASEDRIRLQTSYRPSCATMGILLTSDREVNLPVSVALHFLKGPASPLKNKPGQLRHLMKGPNTMLNYIHAPAEPVDMVRDLGAFIAPKERDNLWPKLAARDSTIPWSDVHKMIRALYVNTLEHDGDPSKSWDRILRGVPGLIRSSESRSIDSIEAALSDTAAPRVSLSYIESLLNIETDTMDVFTLGTHILEHDVPGEACLIDDEDVVMWLTDTAS